jgi:hypothetical protein
MPGVVSGRASPMRALTSRIGARPSTLRPLGRMGPESDVLWDEALVLLRRSNPAGEEIRDFQKTKVDQDIPLPPALMRVLRAHVAALPLARQAHVHDIILRAISGHQTEKMQRHYSTAQHDEMRAAVGKVISIATARQLRGSRAKKRL